MICLVTARAARKARHSASETRSWMRPPTCHARRPGADAAWATATDLRLRCVCAHAEDSVCDRRGTMVSRGAMTKSHASLVVVKPRLLDQNVDVRERRLHFIDGHLRRCRTVSRSWRRVALSPRCSQQAFNIFIHTCIHTSIHTYIHACIHTYIHTYIHIYIHTCRRRNDLKLPRRERRQKLGAAFGDPIVIAQRDGGRAMLAVLFEDR
jgi:hypothetical protein